MSRSPAELYLLRRRLLDDHLGSCLDCIGWWYEEEEGALPSCGDIYYLQRDLEEAREELTPLEQLATEALD